MSDSPIISVLIPVYNSAEHLRLCMNSLINQSFEDYEIIAVNNGSEDNSLEILEEYAQEYPDKVFVYTIVTLSVQAEITVSAKREVSIYIYAILMISLKSTHLHGFTAVQNIIRLM